MAELRRVYDEYSSQNGSDVASTEDFSAQKTRTTIGNYKLLQPIGEGGMGTVYMAEQQEPVRRRVALKIITVEHHNLWDFSARVLATHSVSWHQSH